MKGLVVFPTPASKAAFTSFFPASSAPAFAVDWLQQERAVLLAAVTQVSGVPPERGTPSDVRGEV